MLVEIDIKAIKKAGSDGFPPLPVPDYRKHSRIVRRSFTNGKTRYEVRRQTVAGDPVGKLVAVFNHHDTAQRFIRYHLNAFLIDGVIPPDGCPAPRYERVDRLANMQFGRA